MTNEINEDLRLNDELRSCFNLIEEIDSSADSQVSSKFQNLIASTIEKLENITRQVSQLGIFGNNEDLSELPTTSIRFLILPALLGYLTEKSTARDRKEILEAAEVYFKDFMIRLKCYNVIANLFWIDEDKLERDEEPTVSIKTDQSAGQQQPAENPNAVREEKIRRYRQRQELKSTYESLKKEVDKYESTDDEKIREFYVAELKMWSSIAEEMLHNIEKEKPLVERMNLVNSGEIKYDQGSSVKRNPLKPIIITRTALQKKIFGLGYPSVPTLSLEEFFEQKRAEGQIQVVQNDGEGPVTEEDERIIKEYAAEHENQDYYLAERDNDEYKDDHRRGCGSTKNKG